MHDFIMKFFDQTCKTSHPEIKHLEYFINSINVMYIVLYRPVAREGSLGAEEPPPPL